MHGFCGLRGTCGHNRTTASQAWGFQKTTAGVCGEALRLDIGAPFSVLGIAGFAGAGSAMWLLKDFLPFLKRATPPSS
jgi:hypothetical protein